MRKKEYLKSRSVIVQGILQKILVCLRNFLRTSFLTIIHLCKQLVRPTKFSNSKIGSAKPNHYG